jgi:hypothetical protein
MHRAEGVDVPDDRTRAGGNLSSASYLWNFFR